MRMFIPNYNVLMAPLQSLLDRVVKKAGSKEKKKLSKIAVSEFDDGNYSKDFESVKSAIKAAVMLSQWEFSGLSVELECSGEGVLPNSGS